MLENLAPRLEGRLVTLEPLGPEHEQGLRAAADDERIWQWMLTRDVEAWIADALASHDDRQPFAVLHEGSVVGSTSYMSLAPEHRRLEIGNTWLNPSAWGTGANTEAKYLLLRHAFEELGALRVEFKRWRPSRRSSRGSTDGTWSPAAASGATRPGTRSL